MTLAALDMAFEEMPCWMIWWPKVRFKFATETLSEVFFGGGFGDGRAGVDDAAGDNALDRILWLHV